jgi:hypothetical protein
LGSVAVDAQVEHDPRRDADPAPMGVMTVSRAGFAGRPTDHLAIH